MSLSPFYRTALITVLALVAAAMIAMGTPPIEAAASRPRAAAVPPVLAAMLSLAQKAES